MTQLQSGVGSLIERMRTQLHVWEDEEPTEDWWTYQREYAEAFLLIQELDDALGRMVAWYGKRDNLGDDDLLPPDEQEIEVAGAMRVLDKLWGPARKPAIAMEARRAETEGLGAEPTAADYFAFLTREEYEAGEWRRIFDGWRDDGCQQVRVTIVSDEYPHEPYPHGFWLEGWSDKNAQMLPFGEAETPGGPCFPGLTAQTPPSYPRRIGDATE